MEGGVFVWLVSEEILDEYKEVLVRLGVRRNLIGNIINLLREEAEFLDVRFTVDVSPDPGDNPFCACAEAGNAAFIVTLNPKDFPQAKLRARVHPTWRLPSNDRAAAGAQQTLTTTVSISIPLGNPASLYTRVTLPRLRRPFQS